MQSNPKTNMKSLPKHPKTSNPPNFSFQRPKDLFIPRSASIKKNPKPSGRRPDRSPQPTSLGVVSQISSSSSSRVLMVSCSSCPDVHRRALPDPQTGRPVGPFLFFFFSEAKKIGGIERGLGGEVEVFVGFGFGFLLFFSVCWNWKVSGEGERFGPF